GKLRAGNLNSYQQGAEGEHHEGESYCCEGFEQSARARLREAQQAPPEPCIEPVQKSGYYQLERNRHERNQPERRFEIVLEAVKPVPAHHAFTLKSERYDDRVRNRTGNDLMNTPMRRRTSADVH